MTNYRKQQSKYIIVDLISSIVVWLCFLFFRWLVYEGKMFTIDTVLIPAFDFYQPLILYPLVCLTIYYLSGYYIRPFKKSLYQEFQTTLVCAIIIALGAFFMIIIDDKVQSYHRYLTSLGVLFGLQFTLSYIPRLCITCLTKNRVTQLRTFTLHSPEQVAMFAQEHLIQPYDEVILDLPNKTNEQELYNIISQLYPHHIQIAVVPRVYDMLTGAAKINELDAKPLIRITEHHASDAQLCIKRAMDILLSALALIVCSPLFLVIAMLIRCDSEGSIFYKQERIGLHGIPFWIIKFRTMFVDAESGTPQLTQENDPRITKIGRVLRKYRLDELPQLWNILKGDMSIVGPRPERAYFIQQIMNIAPYYCLLYKIKPGLASWGPIRVGYTDTIEKMVERLNYDIVYMENMSIKLDIKILFYTINIILKGKGK